jgi:xylan 1,4-beta-xylosidase
MPNDYAVATSTEPIRSKGFANLTHKVSKLFKPWMIVKLLSGACVCAIALAVGMLLWVVYWPLPNLPHSSSLPQVNNVKGMAGSGTLTLTWDESPGAIGYQVLRSETPRRNYIVAGSPYGHYPGPLQIPLFWDRLISRILPGHFGRLPRPPFVNTALQPGHTYYYRVRATDSAGWTTLTAPVGFSIRAPDATPPTLRLQVDAVHTAGTLQHKWEMAVGSERLSYMLNGDITPNIRNAGISLLVLACKLYIVSLRGREEATPLPLL